MERAMKRAGATLGMGFLGTMVLAGTVIGTTWVLHSRASDGGSSAAATAAPPAVSREESAVCIGHVDVDQGIQGLYPAQPGRVVEVCVHEDEMVKADSVLLRLDDRQAGFLVREAEADLRASQFRLAEARKLPQKQELALAQQQQAIRAAESRLAQARLALERKRLLQQRKILNADELVEVQAEQVKEAEAGLEAEREKLRALQLADPLIQVGLAEIDVVSRQTRRDEAQLALDECSLKAPADGKVLRILVGKGEVLGAQPRQPAIQFCPGGPRMVRAEVEQEFAGRVALGQMASVQDDSRAGPIWSGKVIRISDWYTHRRSILQEPLQFNDVRTLECIIELEPHAQTPRIGQRVRVTLGQASALAQNH
jgi:HlyD family secretion protein